MNQLRHTILTIYALTVSIGFVWVRLDWIGLDWIESACFGLGWIGWDLDCIGLVWNGFDSFEFGIFWFGLDWNWVVWIGSDWFGLHRICLDWFLLDTFGLRLGTFGCCASLWLLEKGTLFEEKINYLKHVHY